MPPQRMGNHIGMMGSCLPQKVFPRKWLWYDGQDPEGAKPLVPVLCHPVSSIQKHWWAQIKSISNLNSSGSALVCLLGQALPWQHHGQDWTDQQVNETQSWPTEFRGAFDHSYRWWPEMQEAFRMVFWHIGSLVDYFDNMHWKLYCLLKYKNCIFTKPQPSQPCL